MITRLKPMVAASATRRSDCATGLSSPPRPTSPKNAMSFGVGRSAKDDAMASATATSVDGSSSFSPPTMFTKTSCWCSLEPRQNFPSTASSSCRRSGLNPTAVLTAGVGGAPCSAAARSAHSACTSSMNGREPCTVTVGAEDTSAVRMRSPMNRALGEGTGHSPSSRISNTPTSSTEPYRFLCPRSTRTARSASPSMYSTTSTMCSSTRGPAMSPLLVTCPMMNTGMPAVFAACSSAVAHSRTCDVDPGEPVASSRNTVWIESTTSAAGRSRTTAAKIASSRVAEYTITPSAWTPKRSAREASCSTLSSPDAYKTLAPAPGPAPSPAASAPAPSPPAKKTPPRARAAEQARHLQRQRAFADARVASDEQHRAWHDAAAEHALDLGAERAGQPDAGQALRGRVGESTSDSRRGAPAS